MLIHWTLSKHYNLTCIFDKCVFETTFIWDNVAEWSKACDSKSLLLWRRRFKSCRCRFLVDVYLSKSIKCTPRHIIYLVFHLFFQLTCLIDQMFKYLLIYLFIFFIHFSFVFSFSFLIYSFIYLFIHLFVCIFIVLSSLYSDGFVVKW